MKKPEDGRPRKKRPAPRRASLRTTRAEELLRASEKRYRELFENAGLAAFQSARDGSILAVNSEFARLFGYASAEDVLASKKNAADFFSDSGRREEIIRLRAANPGLNRFENVYRRKGGGTFLGQLTLHPVLDMAGRLEYLEGFIEDISERRRQEVALRDSEEKFRAAFLTGLDGVYVATLDEGLIIEANEAMEGVFGYAREELLGRTSLELNLYENPADRARMVSELKAKGWVKDQEVPGRKKNGEIFPASLSISVMKIGERPHILGIIRDITERKRAEDAIARSLREKETLLREVYHRTKNNMNVIGAMLSLRAKAGGDPALARIVEDINARIQAMALVHQKLYESRDLSRVDLSEYLRDLAALAVRTSALPDGRIALDIEASARRSTIDMAMPLGLVVTELLSNAFRHAFVGRERGRIRLSLSECGAGLIELTVADDGVGIPAGFDFRTSHTLGLKTVFMLVEHQLGGEVRFESGPGVACRIRIPCGPAGGEEKPA